MSTVKAMLLSLAGIWMVAAVPGQAADLYKYKDEGGTVCVTDSLQSVPKKYRAGMQVIREEPAAKHRQGGETPAEPLRETAREPQQQKTEQQAAAAPQEKTRYQELAARYPWFKPLALVVGVGLGLLIVAMVARQLPSRQLGRVIYFAFFMGIILFGYKSYSEQVVRSYLTVKEKVLTMMKKSSQREVQPPEGKGLDGAGEPTAAK